MKSLYNTYVQNFLNDSKRILKIGLDLPKLWSVFECTVFWDTLYRYFFWGFNVDWICRLLFV